MQPQFRILASQSLNRKEHSSVILCAPDRVEVYSTDFLGFIAFDHAGCFSFNQCVGKLQFNDTEDML